MKTTDFIFDKPVKQIHAGSFSWKSPSNIALVKYWGKSEPQIPKNTSISFTLDACSTITTLEFSPKTKSFSDAIDFEVYFEKKLSESFKPKIKQFFDRIRNYVAFINDYSFVIHTRNTFPHSSGIASSASGMSALALCVMSIEKAIDNTISDDYFYKKASFLARLGSGSAARSVQGPLMLWGKHKFFKASSNLYATLLTDSIHPIFNNYHDTILLVDRGQKKVSSTLGHQLMDNHPFAEQRFKQANNNIVLLSNALKDGDLESFISIVEEEALSLHAMMLTSKPSFILMHPNTIAIINEIHNFRENTKIPVAFTLDAGANVHLLFPEKYVVKVNRFIIEKLQKYCEKGQYINDRVGNGALMLH